MLANATALYPLLVCALLYGFWGIAWLQLGHPPRPSMDDPNGVAGWTWLYNLTCLLLVGLLPGALAMVVAQAARVLHEHRQPWRALARAAAGCAIWAGAFVLVAADPGDVLRWFFD